MRKRLVVFHEILHDEDWNDAVVVDATTPQGGSSHVYDTDCDITTWIYQRIDETDTPCMLRHLSSSP
jgi:hypothetical protein